MKTLYTDSDEMTVVSLLTYAPNATTEAARILALRSLRRDRLRVEVKIDAAPDCSLGNVVTLQYPRYGYTSGRPMKIIGCDTNLNDGKLTLELWG